MATGDNLLPTSALPIGQTPLATIQRPNVPVSVPNPIDVTNFFRMQQGIQNNLGILQNAEELKMRRQQMDLRNYELAIREMDSVMGMVNGAFSDFYNRKSSQRSRGNSTISPLYGGLDPTRSRHLEAMRRNNAKIDAAQAQIDQLGTSLLSSGSIDPAARFETTRNIRNVMAKTRQEMEQDGEFFELSKMHRAYNQWLDQIKALEAKGLNVNAAAVDRLEQEYNQWTEDGTGNIHLGRFRVEDYVYDGGDVLKRMAADAKALGQGVTEFEEVTTTQGGLLEGKRTTRRSLDDITAAMDAKYSTDKGARALFENAVKGKTKENGDPYEFKDWMRDMSAPYAPVDGKESVVSGTESVLIKPGEDDTDPSTGGARTKKGKKGFDNGGLINVLGREPKDQTERDITTFGNNIQQRGFDVTGTGLTPYDWGKIRGLDKKNRISLVEVNENGDAVARGKGEFMEIWDLGFTNEDGEVEIPETLVARFPRAAQTQEGVNATPPPKGSVYQHNIREESLPLEGRGDLGSRNNNPGNLRATAAQIEAGVPVDDKGFIKFETLKEGIEANFKDIDWKLDGKSKRFQENAFLIKKYGKENLAPGKYLDVATVEDLLHVRTPREDYGGDNTKEEFENFLKHLEKRGYPRDMKLKDLQDRFNFNASMFEVESPDAYRRAFSGGGFMPAAHDDEVTVAEDAEDLGTEQVKGEGYVPQKQATLTGEGLARNTMDRLILDDETISEDELRQLFDNPPEELKSVIENVQDRWETLSRKEESLNKLLGKRELAQQLGQDLSEKDQKRLSKLEEEMSQLAGAASIPGLGKVLRAEIAKGIEPELMDAAIVGLFSEEGLSAENTKDFTFKASRFGGTKQGFTLVKSPSSLDLYGMATFTEDAEGNRSYGSVEMMDREEAIQMMRNQLPRIDEESAMELLGPDDVTAFLQQTAQASMEARGQVLQNRQHELDEIAKGSNDVNATQTQAEKKPAKANTDKWF